MAAVRARPLRILAATLGAAAALASSACERTVSAGVYFDPVTFTSARLGAPITHADVALIERIARHELGRAFDGMRIDLGGGRHARYRVGVVQQVRDARVRRQLFVAGASRAVTGIGGRGEVNFSLLASAALSCAPDGANRREMLDAIGRGVGRAAAHELAHQLLPTAPIHDSTDVASYEYASAGRCEQYFGPMHWELAGPLLKKRLG
jgi:hypothetical protein